MVHFCNFKYFELHICHFKLQQRPTARKLFILTIPEPALSYNFVFYVILNDIFVIF